MKLFFASIFFLLIHLSGASQVTASFTFDDSICAGNCINFTNTSTGNVVAFGWAFQGSDTITSSLENPSQICFDTPGAYEISLGIIGALGEVSTFTDSIFVFKYPDSVFAYHDTTIEMGGTAYLFAEGFSLGGLYSWISSEPYNCLATPFCEEVYASPLVTADYVVAYTFAGQCSIYDTVTVTVKYKDVIDVPNTFSPDENGINDKVYVKGPGIVDMTFRIFDRYGRKMFETTSQTEGWDGMFNGKKLNPSTYMWTLDYTLIDGTSNVKSGSITLIK